MWRYPAARASSTARWVSSGGTWKTPKPSCGISTPSLSLTFGTSATGSAGREADGDQREREHEAHERAHGRTGEESHRVGAGADHRGDGANEGGEPDSDPEDG